MNRQRDTAGNNKTENAATRTHVRFWDGSEDGGRGENVREEHVTLQPKLGADAEALQTHSKIRTNNTGPFLFRQSTNS